MPQVCRTLSTTTFSFCPNCRQHSWTIWSRYSSISLESCRSSSTEYVWIYYWFTSERYPVSIFSPVYSTGKWLQTTSRSQIPRKSSSTLDMCFWRCDNSNHWSDVQSDLFSRLSQMVRNYSSKLVTIFTHFWHAITGSDFISGFTFQSDWSNTIHFQPPTNIFLYVHQYKWFSDPCWHFQQECFSTTIPSSRHFSSIWQQLCLSPF